MMASNKMTRPRGAARWQAPLLCLALAAMTMAVFGRTLTFPFVNYDDGDYVYNNDLVRQGLALKAVSLAFSRPECSLYHPLTMLSLMADEQWHGPQAGWFHLTNLLLHTASVVLLFLVLRRMTGAMWPSAFAAALFAIHPLRVESVAWVAERKDVLSGFFFMLTLLAYSHYARQPRLARYLMVTGAFIPALLSKPTVVTLPFVLLLLDFWPLRRTESRARLVMEKIPWLGLSAAACAATVLSAQKDIAARTGVSLAAHATNAVVSYVVYLRQMFLPVNLAVFYPQRPGEYSAWVIAGALLLLLAVTVAALAWRKSQPWLVVGWFWYLGMLFPMIGLVQAGAFAHADRMTYLPQIGLYFAITWMAARWAAQRALLGLLAAFILAACTWCAWKQTAIWQNSQTLWEHTLACTSNNYVAQCNLGNTLRDQGRLDDAIERYQNALAINGAYAPAHYNLANALYDQGHLDEAMARYREALALDPDYADAHYNLGTTYYRAGRLNEAMTEFQRVLQLRPRDEAAENNLGIALLQAERLDEAIPHFRRALQISPEAASPWCNLGLVFLRQHKLDEAISNFQKALQIKPGLADAHYNLGDAFLQKGQPENAVREYEAALALNPGDIDTRNRLNDAKALRRAAQK